MNSNQLVGKRINGSSPVAKVLHTATIMRVGWEADNEGWIVELVDGNIIGATTNHGSLCRWSVKSIGESIHETEVSLESLKKALELAL